MSYPFNERALALPALLSLGALLACTGIVDGPGGAAAPAGTGTPGPGSGSGSGGQSSSASCSGPDVAAAKRIVRLSFNQVANSIGALLGEALGVKVVADFELVDADHRAFPPLQSPREGNSLTDQSWGTLDKITDEAGQYAFDNFAALTSCGAAPTDACAQQFLSGFAQKAYRRPLTVEEQARLSTFYTGARNDLGATIDEAVKYGVSAVLQAPQFLYRTELGPDWREDGALSPFELASMLSYFLTDSGPDQTLLDAAAQNQLSTPTGLAAHVDRILQTDAAKRNLEGAMMSYFSYPNLENQIIQDAAFTGDMRRSMYHEATLFLRASLWGGKLNDLLVSRKAYVNATLAPLYGIAQFPPAGATLDADQFAIVELPANRTGLLTQAGFLANRSRPDATSVVGRGLLIKDALLCTETPEPTAGIQMAIDAVVAANPNASERQMADIRAATSPCSACHSTFDAYGLALDTYDVLGRYRDKDPEGRPIDPTVTLPEQAGGGAAKDIVEVANKLAGSGAFAKCMSKNLINYALADVSAGAADIDSCAVDKVAVGFDASDRSFSALIKAVATSAAFGQRSKGVAQ